MYKKYKLKHKKKKLTSYYIVALVIVFVIFLSTGYALLSDNMKIAGTANLKSSTKPDGEYCNSTYTWENKTHWGSPGSYTYQVEINITNLDRDYLSGDEDSSVEFKIGIGNSDLISWESTSSYNIWQAESVTVENNFLIIKFKPNVIWWSVGTQLTLYPMIGLASESSDLIITSVYLNGKLCTDVTNKTSTTSSYSGSNEFEINTFDINNSSNGELIDSSSNVNSDNFTSIDNFESTNNENEIIENEKNP